MSFLLWASIFSSISVSASSLTESFDTTSRKASSTLTWNIGLGRLHPTITIANWKPFTAAARSTVPDFGDGSNGAFNSTTMANFDSNTSTPTVIDLNTDTYSSLQFTNFELPTGYTLRPFGSNPLVIRSLSDVRILGTGSIDCSGGNGENTKQPETLASLGGTGRCGGGNGGNGGRHTGAAFVASEKGYLQSGVINPVGGAGGANGSFGGGGGGSLYNNANPGDGYDGAGATVGATQGVNFDNQDFSSLIGSAGGGGGGAAKTGIGTDSTGGGGGAGGGVIQIYALRDFFSEGSIRVSGGNGGSDGGVTLGGLGGGGGGGSIIIIAGHDYVNNGQVFAAPGNGGTRGGNVGSGGDGGPGRAWYTDNDNTLTGTGSEDTSCILQDCGTVNYDLGTLEAVTTSIDLQNTRPSLSGVTINSTTSGASTITVSVSGSKDNFAGDNSGWVSVSSPASASKKRYIKFRVQINNQDATNPAYVDDIAVSFSETSQDEYNFGAACGKIQVVGSPSLWKFIIEMLGLLLPYLLIKLSHQLRPKTNFGNKSVSL